MIYRDRRKYVPIEKGFRFVVIPGLTRNPVADFLDSAFSGMTCMSKLLCRRIWKVMGHQRRLLMTLAGKTYCLAFSEYESFGEWVYRIEMKEVN